MSTGNRSNEVQVSRFSCLGAIKTLLSALQPNTNTWNRVTNFYHTEVGRIAAYISTLFLNISKCINVTE